MDDGITTGKLPDMQTRYFCMVENTTSCNCNACVMAKVLFTVYQDQNRGVGKCFGDCDLQEGCKAIGASDRLLVFGNPQGRQKINSIAGSNDTTLLASARAAQTNTGRRKKNRDVRVVKLYRASRQPVHSGAAEIGGWREGSQPKVKHSGHVQSSR